MVIIRREEHRTASIATLVIAFSSSLTAAVVMVGWWTDIEWTKSLVPGLSSMKFNTALCLFLASVTLMIEGRGSRTESQGALSKFSLSKFSRATTWVVLAISLLSAAEYVFPVDLGIDHLLVRDESDGSGAIPGRMSLLTAFCLALFSTAVLIPRTASRGWQRLFTGACNVGALVSFLVVVGYLYEVRLLYQPLPPTSMAIHTALVLFLLFIGAMSSRPTLGWPRLLARSGSIGHLVRSLLPTFTLLPIGLGWLALRGLDADFYGSEGLAAVLTIVTIVALCAVTWVTASSAARLEDLKREKELILAAALENSVDGFILVDLAGRVLDWNGKAETLFGWQSDEARDRLVWDLLVAPEDREQLSIWLRQLEDGSEQSGKRQQIRSRRLDGGEFPLEMVLVPIAISGRECLSLFLRDLTEQQALEAQLRQSQKMDAVGQLTGGVAHDFNNLLSVIIGNLDLLLDDLGPEGRPLAQAALDAASHGSSLVERLLAFSRRQPLFPQTLEVNSLVSETSRLLGRTLGANIEIEVDLDTTEHFLVADPTQLESAIINLAVNARDAMSSGGKITLETAGVWLGEGSGIRQTGGRVGDYCMIAVSDTGDGMTPEVRERVFEPFFTTKDVGKGTGLGLSMVYGFMKQSNGHVKIDSEVGVGTTVRLYLPQAAREAQVESRSSEVPALAPANAETILVVDDDDGVRGLTVTLVSNLGYKALNARDAEEALKVLATIHVDLLFTDVVLTGDMDGRELALKARTLQPEVRVLMTSGYSYDSRLSEDRLTAGVHFLPKPYRSEQLTTIIRTALDGNRVPDEAEARDT